MPKISCHLWAFLMAIQFYLTNVGRTAALNADNLGLDLQIKYIAVGDASSGGLYNASIEAATMTALDNELERYLVNGGEIEPITHTLRFTVSLNSSITADIYEIGLFDENNVLFAVASSTTTPLIQLINEVNSIITFGFTLTDVDNITLLLDVNSPLAVQLMNEHTAHAHPHAQYKRIHNDTEICKVANGVAPKDAVNKEQLDAEALVRSSIDTLLQNSKAALNGDNTQRFKVASAIYADEAITKLQLDNGLSSTFGMLNLANKADINGNLAQVFSVAAAISDDHAVRKSQLDTKANKNGNIAEYFNVAPATLDSHAVTKTQLDSATSGLSINLSGKADKNGDANNVFSVGAATGADHAVRKSQLDEKAELNGDSNEYFSVKDGIDDDHAVNKGQLDNKAALAGSSTQQFSVADGSTQYHAVNKGQLDAVANVLPTKANKNGDAAETFNVANGTSNSHAVNKSQLDAVVNSIPTLPTIATETVLGLVEKATQAEMNSGVANVWPDAQTIVNAFVLSTPTNQMSLKLPNGFVFKIGLVIYGELPSTVVTTAAAFDTPFVNDCLFAFGVPYNPNVSGQMAFLVTTREWSKNSVNVEMVELSGSGHQIQAGYIWLAVGY